MFTRPVDLGILALRSSHLAPKYSKRKSTSRILISCKLQESGKTRLYVDGTPPCRKDHRFDGGLSQWSQQRAAITQTANAGSYRYCRDHVIALKPFCVSPPLNLKPHSLSVKPFIRKGVRFCIKWIKPNLSTFANTKRLQCWMRAASDDKMGLLGINEHWISIEKRCRIICWNGPVSVPYQLALTATTIGRRIGAFRSCGKLWSSNENYFTMEVVVVR